MEIDMSRISQKAREASLQFVTGKDRILLHCADEIEELEMYRDTLFDAVKHGSVKHQNWLKQAIDYHFEGCPVPKVRGLPKSP